MTSFEAVSKNSFPEFVDFIFEKYLSPFVDLEGVEATPIYDNKNLIFIISASENKDFDESSHEANQGIHNYFR